MQLKDFDFKGLYNSDADPKEVFKKLKLFTGFLDHLKGELMTLPLPRNLEDLKHHLMAREDLAYAVALLSKHTYSTLTNLKQVEQPRLCSAVPLVLAAMKERYGLPYESWGLELRPKAYPDRFLGLQLGKLFQHRVGNPNPVEYDISTLRPLALAVKSSGKAITPFGYTLGKTGNAEFDALPVFYRHMLLQTWIFHPSLRHPDMVTNIYKMDDTPEPVMELNEVPNIKAASSSATAEDPWGF